MHDIRCFVRILVASLSLAAVCWGQEPADAPLPRPVKKKEDLKFKHDTFTFVRVQFSSFGGIRGRPNRNWATDHPDSDLNLTVRVADDTGLKTDPKGKVLKLTDAELKKYPFVYLIEPGQLTLSDEEVVGLREYLEGGGFLMVDDFWGEAEWTNFEEQFRRVFPDQPLKDLPIEHPIFHCFYDLNAKPQVPSIHRFANGQPLNAWGPRYRGLTDDQGRLLALICHNTDLADGWARADVDPNYFREMSQRRAYPMGVNVVVYALTR